MDDSGEEARESVEEVGEADEVFWLADEMMPTLGEEPSEAEEVRLLTAEPEAP